jgi:hypothetical protein
MPCCFPYRDYIASVQRSDVRRFEAILAEDFLCSHPNGSLVDRAAFLRHAAEPVRSAVSRRTTWWSGSWATSPSCTRRRGTRADGTRGRGRYTDVWARRDGRWLCNSAHVTRC